MPEISSERSAEYRSACDRASPAQTCAEVFGLSFWGVGRSRRAAMRSLVRSWVVRRADEHEHGRPNPNGDAAVLVSAIECQHPEPFRAVDRHTLLREAARVDALDSDVPSVVAVELMRIIALLGARNGHTAIHPLGEHRSTLHTFPLWLYEFDDGVFVVDAEQSDLVGTELIAVEDVDVDDVLAAVTPLIAYDNEWTIRARRPTFVVHASVLHGLGLINESARATFRMRARNGSVVDATLDAIATGDLLSRFGGDRGLRRPGPAYLRRRRDWQWAEVAADGHAVHVGYNITLGDVTHFALEVEALAGSSRVAVVILDLRQNGGGDNRTYRPLLEALARLGSEKRVAVLTSRLTFSAAMQLIVELDVDPIHVRQLGLLETRGCLNHPHPKETRGVAR